MKRKTVAIVIFAVLASLATILTGCEKINEQVKVADQNIKQQTVAEDSVYDNGKNFLLFKTRGTYTAAEGMIILQEWLDAHPDKEFRIISLRYGFAYYENKRK